MTAYAFSRAAKWLAAAALACAAAAAPAQLQPGPRAGGAVAVVGEVSPAQGRLVTEDGRVFAVTDSSRLETGAGGEVRGTAILDFLQPGMPLRIVVVPDSGEPPVVQRLRVETR